MLRTKEVQDPERGPYGQGGHEVDRLLFIQHGLCAPSRCSLMTGMHTGQALVRGNKEVKPEKVEELANLWNAREKNQLARVAK